MVQSTFAFSTLCANDRPQVIGASQPIVAPLGGDVILPCHVEPQLNVEELTVEWWRPDVPPDPRDPQSNYRYVHRYHDKQHEEDMKKPSYAGRTEMFTDGLKHGNISLKISNVKLSDQGRYRCQIPQLGRASLIMLNVEPRSVETWTTKTPLHPHNLQSPGPNHETDVKGDRLYLSADPGSGCLTDPGYGSKGSRQRVCRCSSVYPGE
ncbi:CD276 antigen-like [Perca flavescens]|uniref:CD276 antigen-like n=1 Tax=Perca flavescens TaxID=8167 RepID=UPI00106E5C69|nr:CD276 antigen-like [Perca flavescens]